jgi:hypothetical protein
MVNGQQLTVVQKWMFELTPGVDVTIGEKIGFAVPPPPLTNYPEKVLVLKCNASLNPSSCFNNEPPSLPWQCGLVVTSPTAIVEIGRSYGSKDQIPPGFRVVVF